MCTFKLFEERGAYTTTKEVAEIINEKQMKNFTFCLVILISLLSEDAFSQNNYRVLSIDSIPSVNEYLITLKKGNKQFVVLSPYNSEKLLGENSIFISKGMKLRLTLIKVDEEKKPFFEFFSKIRNGSNPVYIDGKIYDPNQQYYYSEGISGLRFIECCNFSSKPQKL